MEKTPGERLKALRVKKFDTAKDASRAYGWNEFTYAAHENGLRGIKLDVAKKYAAAFSSTASFILTGVNVGAPSDEKEVIGVPVVARVSAGAFREDGGLGGRTYVVPVVPRHDIPPEVQYSVLVDGNSVNKKIADGAYAICAPLDRYPGGAQHGQLVHVIRERAGLYEHTIKELRYSREGANLFPCSTDPEFQEIVALSSGDIDETVRIHGVVIGAFQPM